MYTGLRFVSFVAAALHCAPLEPALSGADRVKVSHRRGEHCLNRAHTANT